MKPATPVSAVARPEQPQEAGKVVGCGPRWQLRSPYACLVRRTLIINGAFDNAGTLETSF